VAWIVYWLGLFTATHLPPPGRVRLPSPYLDKVIHFALFFGLALLGGFALGLTRRRNAFWALAVWAAVYAVYGILDEWLQTFVKRSATVGDWLADVTGTLAATGLLILLSRHQSRGAIWEGT
jgi:VanZ family protein